MIGLSLTNARKPKEELSGIEVIHEEFIDSNTKLMLYAMLEKL